MCKKHGLTEQDIADYCGIAQTNVNRLKHLEGAEPRWSTGDAMIRLNNKLEMR